MPKSETRLLCASRGAAGLLLISLAALAPGCAGEAAPFGKPSVVTTIGMIADVASRIAGEHAVVESLMQTGVDPHLYKASEGDVRRLGRADLILYNGLNLEGKMADVLAKMARTRRVVAVSEAVPGDLLRTPPEFGGHPDPHVWFDVSLWAMTIDVIERELLRLVPDQEAGLRRNAESLRRELSDLDGWVAAEIGALPARQRILITAHDAFGYFGRRYGMEVMGLQGISTVSEAGLKDVERLVDAIVGREVKAIFVESSVPRRSIEAVQAACGARGHDVAIGGQLFSDAMGPAGTPEGTYAGMVRHNVKTIVEALR
jgi:manganese/zinc/iron transport system substrate-binding protein